MSDTPATSYFQKRLNDLGITDEMNSVMLRYYNAKEEKNDLKPFPVFEETKDGIFIRVYTIERSPINYAKEGSRWKRNPYGIIRLETPIVKPNGDTLKYLLPKGQPVLPFFHPELIDKYDRAEPIPVLYLTEGYFKAFKAQMHGLDCVGLTSITAMRDRETGKLHEDIHKLILKCKVESIVWLTDGDCRNITSKEITDGTDLYSRPAQFFRTIQTFSDLLSSYEHLKKYFAHINSDNLDGKPKGIDDLLCRFPEDSDKIIKEFRTFEKETGVYSVKFNITFGLGKIHRYFMLNDVDTFYLHHLELRPELKGKEFKFHGTTYLYEESEGKCIIKIPSSANNYFRAGDDYYEFVQIPNRYGQIRQQYHRRQRATIKEDNPSKDFFNHIPKYKAFCTVPDHTNYQRIINNCFNLYFPFEWEAEEGDFDITLNFIKHIFGSDGVAIDENLTVPRWELGLDYLQLLYKNPQQTLPILSLVSNERQTGKTTFLKWLNILFTENVAIVGNDDLGAAFNAHWASKLIVGCDETKIDKNVVMEKVKSLSTANNIMMNAKGRDQVAMEFFAKFILCSNNEDNFAQIDKEEIRFWVIKVPTISGKNNVDLLNDMKEEISAFINFLNGRKMITERKERHWFETRLLHTEALEKVQQNSRPTVEKLITYGIVELFERSLLNEITIPLAAIATEMLKRPNDKDYIKRILHQMGYKTQEPARRNYPRLIEKQTADGCTTITTTPISFHGRYYQFNRADFIKDNKELQETDPELPF